jgi:hypothetical protein
MWLPPIHTHTHTHTHPDTHSLPSNPNQIAEALPHSYFNTYGGNNLAMAMGEATLDVVLRENLQVRCLCVCLSFFLSFFLFISYYNLLFE